MIDLQTIITTRGKITVIEKLPFDIKRIYYLHGIDTESKRDGHAHKDLRRLLIAVNGWFTVELDGETILLDSPEKALAVEPLQWLEFKLISDHAVALIVASKEHDETDCVRDKQELEKLKLELNK